MSIGFALDIAWRHPDYSTLRRLGYSTIIRYVSHDPSKDLAPDELREIQLAGLGVALVYETYETRPLSGRLGGLHDAEEMMARLDRLSLPAKSPAYYAVDFAPNDGLMPMVLGYAQGWADMRGAAVCGVYGTARTVAAIRNLGLAKYLWQTSGNSSGVVVSGISLYQNRYDVPVAGGIADINEIMTVDHGQIIWPRPIGEGDMPGSYGPLKFGYPAEGDSSYPIPPVYSGALLWGDAWLSVAADSNGAPFSFRVASKTLTGGWVVHTGGTGPTGEEQMLSSGDTWNMQLPRGTRLLSLWGPWLTDRTRAPFSLFGSIEYGQRTP